MNNRPSVTPAKAGEAQSRQVDDRLDEALEESFPASDPPAISRPRPASAPVDEAARAAACEHKAHDSGTLDEALDESFPASDPPAIVQPHGADDSDEAAESCPMP
ncbi:hypothetical protein K9U40_07850 [Xanthobacter autotrophicus]|uniref:hypothetical protein n=1 Tax=Xanthobacter TaxID=279 RepID=UPI0024ABECF3|nr:hypothetical protein [Xanthobacter autotrophicus]MDI4664245.1 hypothetical protein [Xanthobacter autotrophicus]